MRFKGNTTAASHGSGPGIAMKWMSSALKLGIAPEELLPITEEEFFSRFEN